MRRTNGLGALFLAVALTGIAGCGYSPNPASGTLLCSTATHSCPEGYSCTDGRTCWKDGVSPDGGHAGTGGGGSGGRGGSGGSGGGPSLANLIGTWTFVSPSTRVRACSDGSGETMPWTGDFFDVSTGVGAPLTTYYYCDWNLDVNGAGTTTTIRPGATCSAPNPMDNTVIYTWTGETFTLTTSNGRNATLAASLPYTYQTSTGSGSCTMRFTGTLTKN